MLLVERLGLDAAKLSHTEEEVGVWCFDQKMVVVGNEAVCVAQPIITLANGLKSVEDILAVLVVF